MNSNDDEGLELHVSLPGEQWQPSSGNDADALHAICEDCQRDRTLNGTVAFCEAEPEDYCEIIGRSYRGPVNEWRRMPDGSIKCMAFLPMDAPAPRCNGTLELF